MTLEGILYRMRTGVPWRDVPQEFGRWSKIFRRFNLWSRKGVMAEIFKFLSSLHDPDWFLLTVVLSKLIKTAQLFGTAKMKQLAAAGVVKRQRST